MSEQNAETYKDKWLDEKFKGIYEKLDQILINEKDKSHDIKNLEARVNVVEKTQLVCPVFTIQRDLIDHKIDNNTEITSLKNLTSDINYYSKRPGQIKFLIIGGFVVLLVSLVPTGILLYKIFTHTI